MIGKIFLGFLGASFLLFVGIGTDKGFSLDVLVSSGIMGAVMTVFIVPIVMISKRQKGTKDK